MYSNRLISEVINYIHNKLEYYCEIEENDLKEYKKFIDNINKKHKTELNFDKMIVLRNTYIYFLANSKGTIVNKYGNDIITSYNEGISVINIATKYRLPPISVLYQILIEKQYEYHQIKKMLLEPKLLPVDLKKQMSDINKYNPNHWLNFNKLCQASELWICTKTSIVKKIKTISDVHFSYNMDNLPTIIFDKPISYKKINDIKWIDIRKHMIFNHKLIEHYINKIIKKYDHLGFGLIVFTDIYCSKKFLQPFKYKIVDYSFFE